MKKVGRYLSAAAWALVVIAGLFVAGRLATALPVAAEAGLQVDGTPTATGTLPPITPTMPASTATPAPQPGAIVNPSFETGDLTGWLPGVTNQDLSEPFVAGARATGSVQLRLPAWDPPHGDYAAWAPWSGRGPGAIRLMQDIAVPLGRQVLMFDYRATWNRLVDVAGGAEAANSMIIRYEDQHFFVVIEEAGGGHELARHLILTAPGGEREYLFSAQSYTPYEEDTGLLTGAVDLSQFAGQDVRLVFEWTVPGSYEGHALMQLDNVRLVEGWQQPRTDVSVIVYGGWNGIPARIWVGGTEQETLSTAVNSYGDAQAMWTFYPCSAWPVTVDVGLPAGLDPEQWELKLVRVSSPTLGWSNDEPGAAAFSIIGGQQYHVVYQLVHK